MGALDGRVAVITGAGRGLGREHALLLAAEGARVVVNDLGGQPDGTGEDRSAAQLVVDEIRAAGGKAVANTDDVATWEGAERLIRTAIETFGDLHVLVNNAGILRDRVVFNMSEEDWDAVMKVHLKGHFAPTRFAAAWWREQAKAGKSVKASIINTSSGAGMFGNRGQTNYGAAKAGIAVFTMICAKELERYGVRSNAIAPMARTRLTLGTPGLDQLVQPPQDPGAFDAWDPANVSPLVAYLATEDCPFNGTVFHVFGGQVGVWSGWTLGETIEKRGRWSVGELDGALRRFLETAQERGKTYPSEGTTEAEFNAATLRALGA